MNPETRAAYLRAALGLLLLCGLMLVGPANVRGQGGPPMYRYGWAYINGEGARDGTLVEVRIAGSLVAQDLTQTVDGEPGRYGYPQHLRIDGQGGDQVRFYVAGVQAIESPKPWESGTKRQDLNVWQAWLAAEVVAPQAVNTGSTFEVGGRVTNTGQVPAHQVTAVLTTTAGATLAPGQIPTQTVGTGPLLPGATRTVTWLLECTDTVPVSVTISPAGIDHLTGEPIDPYNLHAGVATVEQQIPAALVARIDGPAPGELVPVGDEFLVSATISNTGQAAAVDVTATLSRTAGAELVTGPPEQTIGTIPGGAAAVVSWTLTCTETVPVTLTVTPQGTDANDVVPAPATAAHVAVEPYDPPYLLTTITGPGPGETIPVGDSFHITATVINTGLTAAEGVTVSIQLQGSAVLSATETPTRSLGTLDPGVGGEVSWTAVCTDTGPITITVTPAGFDAVSSLPMPEARRPGAVLVLTQTRYFRFLPLVLKGFAP